MPQAKFFCNELMGLTSLDFHDTVAKNDEFQTKIETKSKMTPVQQENTPELEIYICGACRPKNASPDNPERPGKNLAKSLALALNSQGLSERFHLKMMQCMSVCSRPATLSVVSPGKFTFTVGDLDPETTVEDVITFAKLYAASEDGIPAWSDRPKSFQDGVVARTPSFGATHQRITELEKE